MLKKTEEIIFAGFGGQGIMLMGRLQAHAGLLTQHKVTFMPSYGAEMRGGTAHSMVKISTREIASPYVSRPTACVAMNQPSVEKFQKRLQPKGLLIVNATLAKASRGSVRGVQVLSLPLTELADKLGDVKVANMLALGVLTKKKKLVSLESLIVALREVLPPRRHNLIPLNEKALRKGFSLV
jgi:2-oxoglutarate ferredoxin oxidoreductase subunit gamma